MPYAAFLLIANVHQAILIEPVSVLAPTLFPEHLHRYARAALRMHALFTITFALLGGLTILAGTSLNLKPEIQSSLTGMIVATPCILLFWLSRCFALPLLYAERARGSAGGMMGGADSRAAVRASRRRASPAAGGAGRGWGPRAASQAA